MLYIHLARSVIVSVADQFHLNTNPDPRIRFVEKRIRIRTKIEKYTNFFQHFFPSDYPKSDHYVIL